MKRNACPACGAVLIGFEFEGVEIDHCLQCGGTWLDPGELEQIALMAHADRHEALLEALDAPGGRRRDDRRCPRCGKPLLEVALDAAAGGLTIDRCPRGDGLWLDRGELAALTRAAGAQSGAVARFLGKLFDYEIHHPKEGT
jgi:Zn-finger nucleic acid-binding protein